MRPDWAVNIPNVIFFNKKYGPPFLEKNKRLPSMAVPYFLLKSAKKQIGQEGYQTRDIGNEE